MLRVRPGMEPFLEHKDPFRFVRQEDNFVQRGAVGLAGRSVERE
jgi:hypothetical protein